jgi:hypothetical protein
MRLAHQAAMENELITADAVEVSEFPHLARKYSVRGVPKTVINENQFMEGGQELKIEDSRLKIDQETEICLTSNFQFLIFYL